jgi:hypothetical protein
MPGLKKQDQRLKKKEVNHRLLETFKVKRATASSHQPLHNKKLYTLLGQPTAGMY